MTEMNMSEEYTGLTPVETPDEMRERYLRLEQQVIATWNQEEQARQQQIDARMVRYAD